MPGCSFRNGLHSTGTFFFVFLRIFSSFSLFFLFALGVLLTLLTDDGSFCLFVNAWLFSFVFFTVDFLFLLVLDGLTYFLDIKNNT